MSHYGSTEVKVEYTIEKKTIVAQPVAFQKGSGGAGEIPRVLASILPDVMKHIEANGGKPAGPPFTHYLSMGESIELEAGIPLKETISASGDIEIGALPGGAVLRTEHIGPYDKLPQAYKALANYVESHDLDAGETIWEYYWTDPGEEPDPEKWRTEIFLALNA